MKYTEQAVETLDDAGSVIANKNIEIEQLRQRVAELESLLKEAYADADEVLRPRAAELEKERDEWEANSGQWEQEYYKVSKDRDALKQQRDELVAAAEAIEIDAEECLDFDECTAMLVPIDTYHKLMGAIASVKENQNGSD